MATSSLSLAQLLHSVFGHATFRANQEAVCRAAIEGRDLLLVMPTGSGKSLCFQLPALARGGTALVISPLIALMDDQAAKLAALGLRVARIHSGLDRAQSRQACVEYLQGSLQFLFIAPERLRVPGFAPMLAKRPPSLIAIDEAHCISQWGHDFRPDYRMLGQYLPSLRPAPVLALTATATPAVQADILKQLGLKRPARFIHGFRRDNLAIEVAEVPVPDRPEVIRCLLAYPERRPAIVYATSRKSAESLAEVLSTAFPAAAYHAGMDPDQREQVQTAFLEGRLQVIVATIAFGMGIDKSDIRTVVHAGLPSTLEGFYQEIGRAGRDGRPSRTFLLHSFADLRTQDFFLNRDYPHAGNLEQIFRKLSEDPQPVEELRERVRLGDEEFDKALEKLEIHGGARVDFGGTVTLGRPDWRPTYETQAQHRSDQLDLVRLFSESNDCRMAALIRHFGDTEDGERPCGQCDICDPAGAVLRQFRRATPDERATAQRIVDALRMVEYKAAGSLRRDLELEGKIDRDEYEALLGALERLGLLLSEAAEYEKDGEIRRYKRLCLTEEGLRVRANTPLALLLDDGLVEEFAPDERPRKKKSTAKSSASNSRSAQPAASAEIKLTPTQEALATRLREWRTAEAKKMGIPAYLVLYDQTAAALAVARPKNMKELLSVNGIGPAKAEKFGPTLLELCR